MSCRAGILALGLSQADMSRLGEVVKIMSDPNP